MFRDIFNITILLNVVAGTYLVATAAHADTLVVVTGPLAQHATDSISWASVGPDQTQLNAGGTVNTTKGASVQVALSGANSILSKVCSANPCSWTGAGFNAGDMLLWTSDTGNGGNGPVRFTFPSRIAGAGAGVQADGPGPFIAKLEAFNGAASLGYVTAASSQGQAVYIGLLDQTGPNITSVVFSLTSVADGLTNDFGLDAVSLTSTLPAPAVNLSTGSLAFAKQLLATTSTAQSVTLKNTGNAPLSISSIVASGDFAKGGNCGSSLAPAASCTISVTFHPVAPGTRSGAITITDNAAGSPHKVNLSGTGTEVKLSVTQLTFPATIVGKSSTPQSLTITNVGPTALSITSIALTGTNPSSFTDTKTCGSSLAAGASCSVTVTFQPKAKGTLTANVAITDNGGASPQHLALTGIGQ